MRNDTVRLTESAYAPLEVYVLDPAIREGPFEEEAAVANEIADALKRLPNGAILTLPNDPEQLWRWWAFLTERANALDEEGDFAWSRSFTATAGKVIAPLRKAEREQKAASRLP